MQNILLIVDYQLSRLCPLTHNLPVRGNKKSEKDKKLLTTVIIKMCFF